MRTSRRCFVTLCVLALVAGCKRKQAPPVDEVWDEDATIEQTDALGALAPLWPAPTRATLDNGVLLYWLREQDTPAFHLRLIVPTTREAEEVEPAAVAVVAEALRSDFGRRLRRFGARVELAHQPGRFELAVHGSDEHVKSLLRVLAGILRPRSPAVMLERARTNVTRTVGPTRSDALATAGIIASLLGESQHVSAAAVSGLGRSELAAAWDELTDPRECVLLVHAGVAVGDARNDLRALSERWRGLGRRKLESRVLERMRKDEPPKPGRGRLANPPAPLIAIPAKDARGAPVAMIGRAIPTPSARERSFARLAQRLLQEELDTRLVVSGPVSLFIVRVPLSPATPEKSLTRMVDKLGELAQTRYQAQRLFQAAQLWLGARVVHASISGEDWTRLWSESMDLADRDAAIGGALARDARAMLQAKPDTLLDWQKRWLDPKQGEPGWHWVVAAADERVLRKLARLTKIRAPDT